MSVPIHVLDLPQLYTHPSATILLQTLARLALKPASWSFGEENKDADTDEAIDIAEEGIPKYLTSIVASPLQWIEETTREAIWEAASVRLSERSGRAAQPTMTRTFIIPRYQSLQPALQIKLIEPSLTADNLGHKTWLASYLLARRLPHLIANSLIPIPDRPLRILELGSGTGLLGITAAALYPTAQTRLTDLPAIVDNLAQNVVANTSLFDADNKPIVDVLDWSMTRDKARANSYDLILVSDPLYSPEHPPHLVSTILAEISHDKDAKVAMMIPLREAYHPEREEMKQRMANGGLVIYASGVDAGSEDWAGNGRGVESEEVRCWWVVWGWGGVEGPVE